ncbi:7tm odorant receptor domain-containing protein [Phthorimaea operculella]|nr:7tm odorant receptor domain-containing protein [Phthorimaea operculella]
MKSLMENLKQKLSVLTPILPYGVTESWEDLNPRLYHAIHIYWLKFYGMWYNDFSPQSVVFWLQLIYTAISLCLYLFLSEMYTYFKIAVFWMNREKILNLIEFLYCEEFKPKEKEHRAIVRRSIERARNVMTYYSTMCVGAVSVGQIEILSYNIRNFAMVADRRRRRDIAANKYLGNSSEDYSKAVLRECIIHHNSIIKYVSMIESAFSLASALQFMLSVMVLCLIGIQFLSIEEPMSHPMQIVWMMIYLTCMLTEFFILCWFGDELIWKSIELRRAAFEAPWLDISPKTAMFIIIFLERCNRPLRVTAGKIFTLSLNTYTVLINWAYKAFAVMRNMKK